MKKDYLRNNYKITATGKMMKMAEEDTPVRGGCWHGRVTEYYKTELYIRCKIVEGILKVAFFQVRDLRLGNRKPAYELLIDKVSGQFFTWDGVKRVWKTAMLDKLDCHFIESKTYMEPKENRIMRQYLEVNGDGYEGILFYQRITRMQQLEARHKQETDAWDLVMLQVPKLPKDWIRWVDKQGIHQNFIFYDYSRKKSQTGYCTWCEREVPIKKPRHNHKGKCPRCRHEIQYKARGKAGNFRTDLETAYLLQQCRDGMVIRQFEINRRYIRDQYESPKLDITEERRVMLDHAFTPIVFHYGYYKMSYYRWIKGEKRYAYFNYYYSRNYKGSVYKRNLPFLSRRHLSRTGLPEMIRTSEKIDPEVYLAELKKTPYLEQLAKAGLTQLALDTIKGKMQWENPQTALTKELGIDRGRMQRLRKNKGGYHYLAWLKYEKDQGTYYSDAMMRQLDHWNVMPSELQFILGKMSPLKVCNYLNRQYAATGREHKQLISTWQDYLAMASRLNMRTELDLIYKPKELLKKHNEVIELCGGITVVARAMELLESYPDIDQICQSIKSKYEFEDKQYRIKVPEKIEEIIVEGSVLGHCLHRSDIYFDRIQRHETYVLFLREMKSPDTPYYTLEIEPDGTVRQKRTVGDFQNEDIIKAKHFIAKWQRTIQKRLTEEDLALAKTSAVLREQELRKLREEKATIWRGHLAGRLLAEVLEEDLMEANRSMEAEGQELPQAA